MSDWLLIHKHTLSTITAITYTLVWMLLTLLVVGARLTTGLAV
jgi:hypothetical protein